MQLVDPIGQEAASPKNASRTRGAYRTGFNSTGGSYRQELTEQEAVS
jgi:hypothetical protein